jgi:5-methylcytosine-specific restriction endonuclease McrA
LCCEQPFVRQKANGVYSCRKKYCSRECAFEARRLKLPAARRPLEIAQQLARWFHEWGDDAYPIVSRCSKCRTAIVKSRAGEDPQRPCGECSTPVRLCPGCGSGLLRTRRWCQECATAKKAEAKRKANRKARRNGTKAPTLRKRCRKFGVTYTPIHRKKVFGRDKWRCQICGVKLLLEYTKIVGTTTPHPRCPTIDHIVPLSFGPSSPGHVWDNVQACCWQCNCERAAMPLDSFVALKATRLD